METRTLVGEFALGQVVVIEGRRFVVTEVFHGGAVAVAA